MTRPWPRPLLPRPAHGVLAVIFTYDFLLKPALTGRLLQPAYLPFTLLLGMAGMARALARRRS